MAITDVSRFGVHRTIEMAERVSGSAEPGAVVVQLRDRQLPFRQRWALGERLARLTRSWGQSLSVNERLDLALALGCAAVHLPRGAVDAARVRTFCSRRERRLWLSGAVHADEPGSAALDAWVISPVFAPRKGRAALGLDGLRGVAARTPDTVRLFALGGVDARTAGSCAVLGVGVAAIGAVYEEPEALLDALGILRR